MTLVGGEGGAHVIRCRETGRPIAMKLGGGTCVCPPGKCYLQEETTVARKAEER